MDDEEENLVGIDDVYSDDFQTQVLVSDLSVLVETVDGWLESDEGIDPDFAGTWAWCCCRSPIKSIRLTELYQC